MLRKLPDETMMKILNHFSLQDQKIVQLVNKHFYRLSNDHSTKLFKLKNKNGIKRLEIELYGDGSANGITMLPFTVILLGITIGILLYYYVPSTEYGSFPRMLSLSTCAGLTIFGHIKAIEFVKKKEDQILAMKNI